MAGDKTELKIAVRYRLSTSFDWYIASIVDGLVGNFGDDVLDFYARRAETVVGQPSGRP